MISLFKVDQELFLIVWVKPSRTPIEKLSRTPIEKPPRTPIEKLKPTFSLLKILLDKSTAFRIGLRIVLYYIAIVLNRCPKSFFVKGYFI